MGPFHQDLERQFVARPDGTKDQIVFKWPDRNIRRGTQLTVEADEQAVFFRDGRVFGVLGQGRGALQSSELPFLGDLIDHETGGSLFRTELYFVSVREFAGLPFGGVVDDVEDPETHLAVGLRVFGDYSLRVVNPPQLILRLVGTTDLATNDQITDWMREQILKVFRQSVVTHISTQGWPVLGIAAHNEEIEAETVRGVQPVLAPYGLQLARMGNFTISIKPEDEETLKKYRRDIQYTKLAGTFQQAAAGEALEAIGQGAANGAGAEAPAILGLGLGVGGALAGAVQPPAATQAPPQPAATAPAPAAAANGATAAPDPAFDTRPGSAACPACGEGHAPGARFCAACGQALAPAPGTCPSCGREAPPQARFCSACGTRLAPVPPEP